MEKKRPGRRTARAPEPVRVPISFRVTPALKAELDRTAVQSGRSLAQEVELRLERSLEGQGWLKDTLELTFDRQTAGLMLAIGYTVKQAAWLSRYSESPRSESWLSNAFVFNQVTDGINKLLLLIKPDGDVSQLPPGCEEALGGYTTAKHFLEGMAGVSAYSVAEEIARLGSGLYSRGVENILIQVSLGSWAPLIRDWLGEAIVAHLRDRLQNNSQNPDPSPHSALGDSSVTEKMRDKSGRARRKRSKPEPPQ
jgi:hypothetical protein